MYPNHVLRRQVRTELKRRRYILYTLLLLSLLYMGFNLVFSDTGLLRYLELKGRETALRKDLDHMARENGRLRTTIGEFEQNDFYVEKHAREEFGLAGPDEYIYIYK
jgi:cell division protein FtsB